MSDEPNGAIEARAQDNAEALRRLDDGLDPMQALGYEAADPSLQARLWGDTITAWERG